MKKNSILTNMPATMKKLISLTISAAICLPCFGPSPALAKEAAASFAEQVPPVVPAIVEPDIDESGIVEPGDVEPNTIEPDTLEPEGSASEQPAEAILPNEDEANLASALLVSSLAPSAASFAELSDWLGQPQPEGAVIHLSCDLFLDDGSAAVLSSSRWVTVDTGPHSLIVTDGSLALNQVEITGQGVEKAVVLLETGRAELRTDTPKKDEANVRVSAYGSAEAGGTALFLGGGRLDENVALSVHSSGAEAVGLKVDGDVRIQSAVITTEGKKSVAILVSEGEAYVQFSTLTASGTDARSVVLNSSQAKATLDACLAAPAPPSEVQVLTRTLTGFSMTYMNFTFVYDEHAVLKGDIDKINSTLNSSYTLTMEALDSSASSGQVSDDIKESFNTYLEWDISSLNIEEPGVYHVSAELPYPYRGYVEEQIPLVKSFRVLDDEVPQFGSFAFSMYAPTMTPMLSIDLLTAMEQFTDPQLFRSDDGGEIWYFISAVEQDESSDFISLCPDNITIPGSFFTSPYLLRIITADGKDSPVIHIRALDEEELFLLSFLGGDRDGGDRVVTVWNPPDTEIPRSGRRNAAPSQPAEPTVEPDVSPEAEPLSAEDLSAPDEVGFIGDINALEGAPSSKDDVLAASGPTGEAFSSEVMAAFSAQSPDSGSAPGRSAPPETTGIRVATAAEEETEAAAGEKAANAAQPHEEISGSLSSADPSSAVPSHSAPVKSTRNAGSQLLWILFPFFCTAAAAAAVILSQRKKKQE